MPDSKPKHRKAKVARMSTGERAAAGCRNPKAKPGHRIAYGVMTSRR